MGTGKTAVGEALAKKFGFSFIDTDTLVEKTTGKSIRKIFETEGEAAFRNYEKESIRKALDSDRVVVATGGGAVLDRENLSRMKEKGIVIGLTASPEKILQRVSAFESRPLLKTEDKLKTIKNLLSHRSPYYAQADRIIDTTSRTVEQTVEEILKVLNGDDSR